ncbi:MAG TPA: response regulator [Opitutaceae bacterium]|jgi:CheY-like chemotaxis protein|nr:response regulator [Opitutaceae bacterium]
MTVTDPVLLVEDSDDDVFFFQRAWQQAGVPNPLVVARDGQEAIDFLAGTGPYLGKDRGPAPGIVLLDLKLPFKSGHEVLAWIRKEVASRRCVVLFLTSSRESTDVRRAYEAGANGYLVKPASASQLTEMVRAFKAYWLDFNVI